jgi:hypothetical protein
MKFAQLVLILGLFSICGLSAMQQPARQVASLSGLPSDIKIIILKNLIEIDPLAKEDATSGFNETIKNITNLAAVDKRFNALINEPKNMIWLVKSLAERFAGRYPMVGDKINIIDERSIANGLANMPGIESLDFKNWLDRLFELRKALKEAVQSLDIEKVKTLIEQGADARGRDENGDAILNVLLDKVPELTPDNQVEYIQKIIAILNLLMSAGADINVQGRFDSTPIAIATMYQSAPVIEAILKYHPDLSIADSVGQTPISWAEVTPDPQFRNILKTYIKNNNIRLNPEWEKHIEDWDAGIPRQ